MAKLTKEKVTNCLKGSALTLATLAGVIGGVIFGLALRTREGKKFTVLKKHSVEMGQFPILTKLTMVTSNFIGWLTLGII